MDGVLFCKFSRKDGTGDHMQLIFPRKLKDEIMYQMHESLLHGHFGKHKTWEWVIQCFYWFGVREDCDLWVEKCDTCASVKNVHKNPEPHLAKCPLGHQ